MYSIVILLQDDFTALMGASVKGHSKCVEALLLRGAEVGIQDEVSSSVVQWLM